VHITIQGPHLQNDLYCVEWDVKLYYTIPYRTILFVIAALKYSFYNKGARRVEYE